MATGSASQSEPQCARHQEGHVGADHEQRAVGQIDDAHDAEDQRQPAGDQEQQQAVLQSIEELREQSWKVHAHCAAGDCQMSKPVRLVGGPAACLQAQASLQPVPGSARFSTAMPITLFWPPSALRR